MVLTCSVNGVPKALQPLKIHGKENASVYMSSVPNDTVAMHGMDLLSCPLSTTGPKGRREPHRCYRGSARASSLLG